MSKPLLAAASVATIAGVAYLCWPSDLQGPLADGASDPRPTGSGNATSGELEVPKPIADRQEVAAPAASDDAWLAHPYSLQLAVRLVDSHGLPVAGSKLRLAPLGCTLDDATKSTDANGEVVLEWPSRRPSGSIVVPDQLGYFRRYELQHGVERKVTLAGRNRSGGNGGGTFTFRVSGNGGGNGGGPIVLSGMPFVRDFDTGGDEARLHPFAVFTTGAAQAKQTAAPQVTDVSSSMTVSLDGLTFGAADEKPAPAAPTLAITGVVYAEDGNPLAEVPLQLFGSGPKPVATGTTDANGQFRFDALAAGDYSVRAGGDRDGLGSTKVALAAGAVATSVYLRRETCVRGRATYPDGKPIAKARVHWLADDGNWWDLTNADADGTFVFANLPDARGTVLLIPPNQPAELPIAAAKSVVANGGYVTLVQDVRALGTLQFELPPWANDEGGNIGVRLWNEDLGLGINLQRSRYESGNRWQAKNLLAGWYRLEVFVPGQGCVDVARQWLEPSGNLDLGILKLPSPCTVELRFGPEPALEPANPDQPPAQREVPRLELYAIRDDLDVKLGVAELTERCDLALPPGDYALARRPVGGAVEWHRFSTRRGEVVRVPASK